MAEQGTEGLRPYRVLVVDDNQDAADTLALLVRIWGHDARVAYDGVEGLRTACAFQPDCMLLDIGLPKLDGYSLARKIRQGEATAHMKLIALTAYSNEEHHRRAREVGFDYQIVKPADPNAVRQVLALLQKVLQSTQKPAHPIDGAMQKEGKQGVMSAIIPPPQP
jgi:CheY-like chemotaxis protein